MTTVPRNVNSRAMRCCADDELALRDGTHSNTYQRREKHEPQSWLITCHRQMSACRLVRPVRHRLNIASLCCSHFAVLWSRLSLKKFSYCVCTTRFAQRALHTVYAQHGLRNARYTVVSARRKLRAHPGTTKLQEPPLRVTVRTLKRRNPNLTGRELAVDLGRHKDLALRW